MPLGHAHARPAHPHTAGRTSRRALNRPVGARPAADRCPWWVPFDRGWGLVAGLIVELAVVADVALPVAAPERAQPHGQRQRRDEVVVVGFLARLGVNAADLALLDMISTKVLLEVLPARPSGGGRR